MEISIMVRSCLINSEYKILIIKFSDIAIGAPNADHVYIYRTYPVVKIITSITPLKKELAQSDTTFQINFCWSLETPTELVSSVGMYRHIKCLHL